LDVKKWASFSSCLFNESGKSISHLFLFCSPGSSGHLMRIFSGSLLFLALLRLCQEKTYLCKHSPSGKEVITYIHEAIPPDKLPIIIISGTGLSEIEHLRHTFPAYVVLRKPFSMKELAQQIKNLPRTG